MPTSLLISDLHLSESTPVIEAGLQKFLQQEALAPEEPLAALYILGDFFEAWIGDDDNAPYIDRIRTLLKQVTDRGTALCVSRGNRDFLLGEAFISSVNGTLLGDQTVVDLAGKPTLLMHGDTLCTDDVDYQVFRTLAHSEQWQAEMLAKSLAERRLLAQQLRAMSVDAASNKAEDIMDVNPEAVSKTMLDAGVTRLIHGHTHRPAHHTTAQGDRIVLGDWTDTQGWCVRVSDERVSLESFPL